MPRFTRLAAHLQNRPGKIRADFDPYRHPLRSVLNIFRMISLYSLAKVLFRLLPRRHTGHLLDQAESVAPRALPGLLPLPSAFVRSNRPSSFVDDRLGVRAQTPRLGYAGVLRAAIIRVIASLRQQVAM